jgi:hypothetical protein
MPCNTPSRRLQVYFLMLPDSQLQNFKTTVILAIVGQSLGLVWMMWKQVCEGGCVRTREREGERCVGRRSAPGPRSASLVLSTSRNL